MFLDPLGNHLLITLVSKNQDNSPPELFYLHRKTTKLKQVNEMNKQNKHNVKYYGININSITEPVLKAVYTPQDFFIQAGKFKGHEITAVGWNFANTSETTTGPILLGTSKALIFETEIGLNGDKIFNTSLEQYWRQV